MQVYAQEKLTGSYSTAKVATFAGVHKDTLLRWLRQGLIPEPTRDRHGWRSFSQQEVQNVIDYASNEQYSSQVSDTEMPIYGSSSIKVLKEIDWDFVGAKTNYLTHSIHPYPAKFIPQIPNALIQELSSVGDTVGDIFCGSGTTLVEALTLKRHAVGIDANPLACLIARSKTTIVTEEEVQELIGLAQKIRQLGDSILPYQGNTLFSINSFQSKAWRPSDSNHNFWFDEHVTEELAEILQYCENLVSPKSKELALSAFSSIIVAVSKQDSDTRYVRREKNIQKGDTFRRFAKALEQISHATMEYSELVEERFKCEIFSESLLNQPKIPQLDLMVCSPPYPNAYSYHLYHRTRMLWLKMNQPRFKKEEIGSHRKYSSLGKNGATVETFKSEFEIILKWLSKNLKKNGYACFVVGNSTLRGKMIDNTEIIADVGKRAGFVEAARINRTMQSTKKAFNPVIGKIKTEQILILQNITEL
jgi:site-specific DNA-methyltransferase (cytosine-N4-specific)